MNTPKHLVIDGVTFCRDDETGYYLNSVLRIRAHRFVFERANGPIPGGYHVHHKDEDKSNNHIDNLELMLPAQHATHHGLKNASDPDWLAWSRNNMAVNATPAASAWHGSQEGLAWHREHAKRSIHAAPPKRFECFHCQAPFESIANGQNKFCSNACKAANRRASAVDHVARQCECCGQSYSRDRYAISRTCSRSCTNRLRAREKRIST